VSLISCKAKKINIFNLGLGGDKDPSSMYGVIVKPPKRNSQLMKKKKWNVPSKRGGKRWDRDRVVKGGVRKRSDYFYSLGVEYFPGRAISKSKKVCGPE